MKKRSELVKLIWEMSDVIRENRRDLYETHKYPGCGMVHDREVQAELDSLDALLERADAIDR